MPDERQRQDLARALADNALVSFEAPDHPHAMAALGRANFLALVVAEGHSTTLQGFCLLARKRHPQAAIFVLLSGNRSALEPPPAFGVGEHVLDGRLKPRQLAAQVLDAVQHPSATPFDVPATAVVWETLERAADERHAATAAASVAAAATAARAQAPPSMRVAAHGSVTSPAPEVVPRAYLDAPVVLAADLADIGGSALLVTIMTQELTGVLHVRDGPAAGLLYFYRGDPVWTEDLGGDAALFKRLQASGKVPLSTQRPDVPQGQLVSALVQARAITSQALQQQVLAVLRERVMALATQRAGFAQLHEDRAFLQDLPLMKVNGFGLVLEAHRRATPAQRLLEIVAEHGGALVTAEPALAAVSARLRPTLRGADLASILAQPMRLDALWRTLGVDDLAGALMFVALSESRVIKVGAPVENVSVPLAESPLDREDDMFALPETEVTDLASVVNAHEAARREIVGLYMRIKPLAAPHQVLGVPMGANAQAVEHAWQALRAQLDPSQVPPGPHLELLLSHLEELRRKVDAARSTLVLHAQPVVNTRSGNTPAPPPAGSGARPAINTGHAVRMDAQGSLAAVWLDGTLENTEDIIRRIGRGTGTLLLVCRDLRAISPGGAAQLSALLSVPRVNVLLARVRLPLLSALDRAHIQALYGRIVDVVVPAACPRCRGEAGVVVDGPGAAQADARFALECRHCGHAGRAAMPEPQRRALVSLLAPHPPPDVIAYLAAQAAPLPPARAAPVGPVPSAAPVGRAGAQPLPPAPPAPPARAPRPPAPRGAEPMAATVMAPAPTPPPPSSAPPSSTAPARYEVLGMLGQGGMAEVMLAQQRGQGGFNRQVALKRIRPEHADDAEFMAMFQDEARVAARINHPNVVHIYELGQEDGRPFIAMEYVRGWDLRSVMNAAIRKGVQIPVEIVCRVAADACAGLHAAHRAVDPSGRALGIVHRDMSPQNVLMGTEGTVKITDFGIARAMDSSSRTRPGTIKGKPAYMAPEQISGQFGRVEARSDVFAMGIVLYEMLTFEPVFRGENEQGTLMAVLTAPVTPPRTRRPDIPVELENVVLKALQRDMRERHESAQALQLALEGVLFHMGRLTTAAHVSQWLATLMTGDTTTDPGGAWDISTRQEHAGRRR